MLPDLLRTTRRPKSPVAAARSGEAMAAAKGPSVPAPAAQAQGSCADPAVRERVPASGIRECCGPAHIRR